jgi:3-phenylpropionate/cinnamic acid dioxygenase small subunit
VTAVRRDGLGPGGAAVMARFDEVAALVASTPARPAADPGLSATASAVVHREARLLDTGQLDAWLSWFTDDAVAWVALPGVAHPAADQSLYLDDRRRLAERVGWHAEPSAWGQHPASTCVRTVGTVEAWTDDGDTVVVRSAFTLVEQRHGEHQLVAGHQVHELVGPEPRCRTKVLLVPALAAGLRNPSFLL